MQSEGAIAKGINKIANAITRFSERVEAIKGKTLEHIAVFLYCTGHMLMFLVHEPWFDEALAWLIARDSSVYDILFVTPHYEGHPSLWHLILVPFAKLGAPYELSLSFVSLLFSGLAMGLFIYRAPFKRIIRITIPFTYYLFYQYGVISRPYCMMMLAFVLMAMTFKSRNKNPGRFVLALWFLCISSAYGIVIAGGICIAWLIEMLLEARRKSLKKNSENGEHRGIFKIFLEDYLFAKGKFFWLLGLFLYVIFILWRIMPADNAYASIRAGKAIEDNGILVRLLYTVFASLSDLFITNVFYTSGTLRNADIYLGEMAVAVLVGTLILAALIMVGGKKKSNKISIIYLIIPYIFFSVFGAAVYLYYHHIGISLLLIGYWLWIVQDTKTDNKDSKSTSQLKILNNRLITDFGVIAISIMIIIPLFWTVGSCVNDIINSYGSGRGQYQFLSDNGLDEGYTILADWNRVFKQEEVPEDYAEFDPIFSQQGVNLTPYLKKSKVINSPKLIGKDYSYQHEIPNKTDTEKIYAILQNNGMPDIIIGKPEEEFIKYSNYVLVYKDTFGNIKKGFSFSDTNTFIYIREELAKEKGLKEISGK